MNNLDHKSYAYQNCNDIVDTIKAACIRIDQKHPLDRKLSFLLTVRGYLKINQIKGSYVEFGSYKSEMQFAAYNILEITGMVDHYIGLDTFEGEPAMTNLEAKSMPINVTGDFMADMNTILEFTEKYIGNKSRLIKGDFRKEDVLNKINPYLPICVCVIDCNLLSSIKSSLHYFFQNFTPGAILYIDDYFTNISENIAHIHQMIKELSATHKVNLIEHGFFPPFGKSFICLSNHKNEQ